MDSTGEAREVESAVERVRMWARTRRGTLMVGAALVVLLGYGVGAVATGPRAGEEGSGLVAAVEPAAEAAVDPGSEEDRGPALDEEVTGTARSAPPEAEAGGEPEAEIAEIEWASPSAESPVKPVAAEERVAKPAAVRGIYVGGWSAGSERRLPQLIRLADETEVNAFVIDVKDVTGELTYASRVPLAEQVGATRRTKIGDIRGTLARLRDHGIYPIARIVVFKDPLLATARPEWSIQRSDGTVWEDQNGVHWVDSYNRAVWDYNIALAREAIALGFSEIQWDYVRFPDVPASYMMEAVFPAREGRSKADGIREFMLYARERLADLEVPVTADVFGITTSADTDVGIGQLWEKMSDAVDVLLPMVYPSHYPRGSWDFPNPNAAPYQIVKKAMGHGVRRSRDIENAAAIRPWLQAFSLGEPEYGPRHIRAQIDAVYDAGLTEWVLWHPAVRYPREAFATADGEEPWFAGLGASLYEDAELEVPEPEVEPVGGEAPLGEPIPDRGTGGG